LRYIANVNSVAPSGSGFALAMIVSGGQTGADRAALDWALAEGIPHGGWCPRGRRAEDGVIPDRYRLRETQGTRYAQRTEWNVRDSDGTVIFTVEPYLRGGSRRTAEFAREYRKPWLHLDRTVPLGSSVERFGEFVIGHRIAVLNIAGSRASEETEVGEFVRGVLTAFRESLRQTMELADDRLR
jgi:hypothetical protein